MKAKELIKSLDTVKSCCSLKDFEVKGISCNSKTVGKDFIFVAIKGNHQDGSEFIDEAIENGAKAIVIDTGSAGFAGQKAGVYFIKVKDARRALANLAGDFYGNPSGKIKVVGVTGTNGKTTITYLIEALLKEAGAHPAVIGTINYRFKNKEIPSKNTTPGPIELESMLACMLKEGISYVAMEVSSHALDQDRTMGIKFHSAIYTNLTQDHLDYHKTLKDYFLAKAKLFKAIGSDAFAVINNDDKYSAKLKTSTKARIVTYGIKNKSQVMAKNIKFDVMGTEFELAAGKLKANFKLKLIGKHNVYNILAAVAWGLNEGIDINTIKSSMESFSLVPGRLERVDAGTGFSIFVDYAHTEDALKNILFSLRLLSKKRIIVVFGCGGDRDKTKRPKMGRVVSELADYAIITSDNPRSEDPLRIIEDIRGGMLKKNYSVIPERLEAIKRSLSIARQGDVVLVAGKGHENYQILKDKALHFDDRKAIRECLKSMN